MMDFLDPKKTRANTIRLYIGYVLLAIAIVLAVIVLMYQAGGFGVDSQGKVIQNGLVFVSSSPSGADIYLNDEKNRSNSNARLTLQSGTYALKLTRDGYRDWQRALTVEGGSVEHVDYPLLIPRDLTDSVVTEYGAESPLTIQSPDRRWLMVQQPGAVATFDVYDLKDPKKVKSLRTSVEVPAAALRLGDKTGQQTFELSEWSRDNEHVLLKHVVGQQSEYVMLSRTEPETSQNLTERLQLKATETVSMRDKKYDRYFVHDTVAKTLSTVNLDGQPAKPLLSDVISFKTYGEDVVLYATSQGADEGKVSVMIYQFEKSYLVRQVMAGDKYLLDLSTYGDDWYVAVGSAAEDHLYVYQNPAQHERDTPDEPLIPADILKLESPDYLEFSANSQFVMVASGQNIAVFDVENEKSFTYRIDKPIDPPQTNVTWMDGFHLTLVSEGVATIFDYDGTNMQSLVAATPNYIPFFDTAYQNMYTLAPRAASPDKPAGSDLNATPLRTERDR